jgi:type IV pilus assembly protein PilC
LGVGNWRLQTVVGRIAYIEGAISFFMFSLVKIYVWQGITQTGQSCKGKTVASDAALLRLKLSRQGIIVRAMQPRRRLLVRKSIKAKDLLFFTQQLARLLQAGLPLVQVLELLENSSNNRALKEFNQQLRLSIENGASLSEVLKQNQDYFGKFYTHLIALGEKTASLATMLKRIADHMEKNLQLKAKLFTALLYPSFVIGVASFVFFALLIGVVPQFERLFTELGAELPLLTRIVISLAKLVNTLFLFSLLFFLVVVVSFFLLKRKYRIVSIKQDQFLTKLPFVKKVFSQVLCARLSRALSTALVSGLPLLEALQAIAELTKNYVYRAAILSSCELIRKGESFYNAFSVQNVLPLELLQFIKIGEISANLAELLNNAADLYEERLDNFVANLSKLLEPLLVISLGIIIGTLIIAMYLPIFKLGSVI